MTHSIVHIIPGMDSLSQYLWVLLQWFNSVVTVILAVSGWVLMLHTDPL